MPARCFRAVLSGVLLTLVASMVVGLPAQARPSKPDPLRPPAEPLLSHGHEARGRAWTQKGQPAVDTPAPVWPKAGSARVALPTPARQRSAEAGGVRAGTLPVWVDRAQAAAGGVSAVTVEVLDRTRAPAAWRAGLLVRVGSPTTGAARVSVDYSGFRYAFGAGWDQRLRLWRVPDCALTTPDRSGCTAQAMPSRNLTSVGLVSADVPLSGEAGTLLMLAADPAGRAGDFTATSLAPSATWSTGGSSGNFSWSYPMRSPPGLGDLRPDLKLTYSSSSVDGRSEATNNQPSWIGEGFEFWPGYIERGYVPCAEDMSASAAGEPNNSTKTGDLCWRSDNAVMSLNGSGSELVWQSGKGWHARNEDATKIEKVTGGTNGDDNGEYWKVTTSDGTQYFFGRNSLPGYGATTNSAWTVPVYGNHPGEFCHATAFADSDCPQAWRWNLDYVVDPHGNTMSYWYDKELNQYAARLTDSANEQYVRGGHLKEIQYGTWDRGGTDRSVTPFAKVAFATADRCLSSCGTHNGTYWPDVPWDQECAVGATSCAGKYAPTFWSTRRLSTITTWVWDTTRSTPDWEDVDSWTFTHSFPSPGDGTNAGLWLASISHQGLVGTAITMPPATFEPVSLPNRVLTQTNTTNNWQRMANIVTEAGAKIQISYSLPECTSTNRPSAAESNTMRCYPVIAPDPYASDGSLLTEWWHKYVVTQVSESDIQLSDGHQSPTKNTYYQYGGSPAWHYADDDGLSKPKYKTWNQFRGYATVTTRVGDDPALQTLTRSTFLRGMHGDRATPSGGTRTVTVGASLGSETVYDEDAFADMVRERVVYNGVESKPVAKTVSVPWQSPATASRTINGDTVSARFAGTQTTYTSTALGVDGQGGWRTARTRSTFDNTYGTVASVQNDGDIAVTGDETCVATTYNRNTDKNIVTLPKRVTTTTLPCGTAPATTDDITSDVRTTYDAATSPDTAPSRGLVTKVERLNGWTSGGGTVFQTASQATHDLFGRVRSTTDVRGNTTRTEYTPASGGPVTKVTDTSPSPYNWVTTTDLAIFWGVPAKKTDANDRVSEAGYDALGRVAKVWRPGWSRASNPGTPSEEYTYTYSPTRSDYPYTTTKVLNAAGGYLISHQIFDGFLRARQTQAAAVGGGRIITDTTRDAWGRTAATYPAHAESGTPSGTLWWEPEWSLPAVSKTLYDRADRATAEVLLAGDDVTNLVEKWRTTTGYLGDRTTVTPPDGGVATTTVIDIEGRTVQLRQHTTAAGIDGAYNTTAYTYNRKGQLTKVTDASGNEWSYTFDVKGRQIQARDPDKGLTTSVYNDVDDIVKTTDARGEALVYAYDQLGRKVGLYDDSVSTATKRAEWRYDTTAGGVTVRGQLTHTIRYEGGHAYQAAVANVTAGYQPTGMVYVIPDTETGLAGTYTVGYGYSTYDGSPTSVTYPAMGGLGAEQVTTGYDAASGRPTTLTTNLTGVTSYVTGQQYTSYGEPSLTTLKIAGGVYVQELTEYDRATRRISRTTVKPETATGTIADRRYEHDPAGNIRSIADTPVVGPADTQCFRYDKLRRLTSAWTPKSGVNCQTNPAVANLGGPAAYWLDWTLDAVGNRTAEVSHATAGDTTRTYALPTPGAGVARPHAVTAVTTAAPGQTPVTRTYGYDAAGNTNSRPPASGANQSLTWDSEGHLVSVGGTATSLYDVDGVRLIRRDGAGSTLYLPGIELRYDSASATRALTRYYNFVGKTVASRTVSGGLVWLLSDHQGTQQITVNVATQVVTIRRQTPFGGARGTQPAWPNQKGFVGGDNDGGGLVHIGAREYDAALGRFISVDPIMDLKDPQQWNAYAYSNNNPITFADPTGLRLCSDDRCGPGADYEDDTGYHNVPGDNDGCGGNCGDDDWEKAREDAKKQPKKGPCGKGCKDYGRNNGPKWVCGRSQCYWATTAGKEFPPPPRGGGKKDLRCWLSLAACAIDHLDKGTYGICANAGIGAFAAVGGEFCIHTDREGVFLTATEATGPDNTEPVDWSDGAYGLGAGAGLKVEISDAREKNDLKGTASYGEGSLGPVQGGYTWTDDVNIISAGGGYGAPFGGDGGVSKTWVGGYLFRW